MQNIIKDELDVLIRARYSVIYIESPEEVRTVKLCREIAEGQQKALFTWSLTQGLMEIDLTQPKIEMGKPIPDTQDPIMAMSKITEVNKPSIVILKDFHRIIDDNIVCRAMRDLSISLQASSTTVIIVSPVIKIPTELQKEITVVSLPLPNVEEISAVLENVISTSENTAPDHVKAKIKQVRKEMKNGLRDQVLNAAKGLTLGEAENVFSKSLIANKKIDIRTITAEKEQVIKKSGILEFFADVLNIQDIGGLDNLKIWIQKRKKAFTAEAKKFKLRTPRGVFLTGLPGVGKSLSAKAIAGYFEMPLLRLDVSKIFSGVVGSSEQNISQALKTAEAVAPCVLWIDEVEKALAGVQSSGQLDSGVTARVFGTLLTWMQEHKEDVFLVVTSNNPLSIPPEFMRRFDEVFFVDLPTIEEREEIYRIHLTKVARDPEAFNISQAASISEGYSGAEIEKVIMAAMYDAFDNGDDITDEYIYGAIKKTIPLSEQRKEEIAKLREWSKVAINASKTQVKESGTERKLDFQ